MAIREVVRFICDDTTCKHLPAMTYDEAIRHAEMHIRANSHLELKLLEDLWNVA